MGGMVLETNMSEILTRIEEQGKLEKSEVGWRVSLAGNKSFSSSQVKDFWVFSLLKAHDIMSYSTADNFVVM